MYLQFGSKGDKVKEIQRALNITVDGIFGRITEAAVKNFQKKNGIFPNGVVDYKTSAILLGEEVSTDLSEHYYRSNNIDIQKYYLPKGEYIEESTPKDYIFLHHTMGWHNPFNTVEMWARDERGRIGTQFIIGGQNHRTNSNDYDGVIVECFNDQHWAYHLGRVDKTMQKNSVGIELCCFGQLTKKQNNFYTYTNKKIHPNQVVDLGYKFKGFRYWHSYSDEQLRSLKELLLYLSNLHNIDLSMGIRQWVEEFGYKNAFNYYRAAKNGHVKGLLSHSNVRIDKLDAYPHPYLIDLIMSL